MIGQVRRRQIDAQMQRREFPEQPGCVQAGQAHHPPGNLLDQPGLLGRGDEDVRPDQFRPVPEAQQRLRASPFAGHQIDHGLVFQVEFVAPQPCADEIGHRTLLPRQIDNGNRQDRPGRYSHRQRDQRHALDAAIELGNGQRDNRPDLETARRCHHHQIAVLNELSRGAAFGCFQPGRIDKAALRQDLPTLLGIGGQRDIGDVQCRVDRQVLVDDRGIAGRLDHQEARAFGKGQGDIGADLDARALHHVDRTQVELGTPQAQRRADQPVALNPPDGLDIARRQVDMAHQRHALVAAALGVIERGEPVDAVQDLLGGPLGPAQHILGIAHGAAELRIGGLAVGEIDRERHRHENGQERGHQRGDQGNMLPDSRQVLGPHPALSSGKS